MVRENKIDIDAKKILVTWPAIGYDSDDKDVREFYSKADGTVTSRNSVWYKKKLTDIFAMAMLLGKKDGLTEPYLKNGEGDGRKPSIDSVYFADSPKYVWLMMAIALEETNFDLTILDQTPESGRKIVDICEKYANHGIHELINIEKESKSAGSFLGYERKLRDLLNGS